MVRATIVTNSSCRNVVRASTTYAPPNANDSWLGSATAWLPTTAISAATIARPPNVVIRAGTVRPGRMKSTVRIAAATRIVAMNGARVATSCPDMAIGPLPQDAEGDGGSLLGRGEHRLHRAVDQVQQQPREQAEDDDGRGKWDERQRLDRPHVGQARAQAPEELGEVAEHDALEHPQQVPGGEDHHERGDRGGRLVELERAHQREELADEPGQARQPDRREHEEPEGRRVHRDTPGQPAH